MKASKDSLLKKVCESPQMLRSVKLNELVRVYQDLEKTLKGLRETAQKNTESQLRNINVRKLIQQLSRSKRRLERKIGNTFSLETQHLKKRIRAITSNLSHKEREL